MKTYKVPVVYQVWGLVEVEAENRADLERKLKDEEFVQEMPLADDPDYIDESYEIDWEGLESRYEDEDVE